MSAVNIKHIKDITPYEGPYKIEGINFRYAAKALGVSAWGMNILELEPGVTAYPTHDHSKDGQEEVYVILKGSAVLKAGDVEHQLKEGSLVRVAPEVTRHLSPGPQGVTILALGGTPGAVFQSQV